MRLAVLQHDRSSGVTPPAPAGVDVLLSRGASTGPEEPRLGRVVVLEGDDAIDVDTIRDRTATGCDTLVLCPESESDLQAEAVLELALGLSESVAGLVVVLEDAGAEPGHPGHGGSAIVLLGEVLAEAVSDADVLEADVPEPVPSPVPREPVPGLPPILAQRLAHHRGERPEVGYLADV